MKASAIIKGRAVAPVSRYTDFARESAEDGCSSLHADQRKSRSFDLHLRQSGTRLTDLLG